MPTEELELKLECDKLVKQIEAVLVTLDSLRAELQTKLKPKPKDEHKDGDPRPWQLRREN